MIQYKVESRRVIWTITGESNPPTVVVVIPLTPTGATESRFRAAMVISMADSAADRAS